MEWALSFTGLRGVLRDHFEINKMGVFDEENDTPLARNETGGYYDTDRRCGCF